MAGEGQRLLQCDAAAPPTPDLESFDAAREGHAHARLSLGGKSCSRASALVAFLGAVCLLGVSSSGNGSRLLLSVGSIVGLSDKPLTPWMGEHDMARLYQLMSNATYYREFGAGGSTVSAVGFSNIKKVVSTESDPAWVADIKKREDVEEALASKRLVLEHGDIGPVKVWGYPKDDSAKEKWPAYSDMNNSHAQFNPPFWFDLIFVDGRFRVACLLKAAKATTPERRNTTWFAMHDYVGKRGDYHAVEEFVDRVTIRYPDDIDKKWIAKAHDDFFTHNPGDDVLGVFQKRADVDEAKLDAAIRKFELHKH